MDNNRLPAPTRGPETSAKKNKQSKKFKQYQKEKEPHVEMDQNVTMAIRLLKEGVIDPAMVLGTHDAKLELAKPEEEPAPVPHEEIFSHWKLDCEYDYDSLSSRIFAQETNYEGVHNAILVASVVLILVSVTGYYSFLVLLPAAFGLIKSKTTNPLNEIHNEYQRTLTNIDRALTKARVKNATNIATSMMVRIAACDTMSDRMIRELFGQFTAKYAHVDEATIHGILMRVRASPVSATRIRAEERLGVAVCK